jgi:hypothetical protein
VVYNERSRNLVNEEALTHRWLLRKKKKEVHNASVPLRTDFKAGISIAKIQSSMLFHSSKSTSIVLPPSCTASYTILVQSSTLVSINLAEVFSNN